MAAGALRRYLAGRGGFGHFEELAGFHVVDVAVNRDGTGHQRVLPNALHVFHYARGQVFDGEKGNEFRLVGAGALAHVVPSLLVHGSGFQALSQQVTDNFVGEVLHAAVGVVNNEPLPGTQQLVGNHQRADGVVAGPAARVSG